MAATPTTPTEVDRVRAAGVSLPLTSGSEVRVRFSLSVLARIEADLGSLSAFTDRLQSIQLGAMGSDTPWVSELADLLRFLFPDVDPDDYAGSPHELAAGVFFAWLEAFPAPDPKGGAVPTT